MVWSHPHSATAGRKTILTSWIHTCRITQLQFVLPAPRGVLPSGSSSGSSEPRPALLFSISVVLFDVPAENTDLGKKGFCLTVELFTILQPLSLPTIPFVCVWRSYSWLHHVHQSVRCSLCHLSWSQWSLVHWEACRGRQLWRLYGEERLQGFQAYSGFRYKVRAHIVNFNLLDLFKL